MNKSLPATGQRRDYLFASDWRPLNLGLLLHLHRLLLAETAVAGGCLKESDNVVVDRSPEGLVEVRFVPVTAARSEYATVVSRRLGCLCTRQNERLSPAMT